MAPLGRRPLDRYVGVTDRQVLELEAHRTRLNQVSQPCLVVLDFVGRGEVGVRVGEARVTGADKRRNVHV